MELSGYLAVARRWWWTLLVAAWVAAVSAYVVASQIAPTYEARVQLLVGPYNTDTETLRAAGQLVQTYAELVTTEPLLASAIAEAGEDIDPSALGAATRVVANDTTRFLTIRVQDTDRVRAATLANGLAGEISSLASRGTSRPEGQLQVVDIATPPVEPIAPQVSLIVGLATLAALLGAMVLVMLVEYLSATVRTEEDLHRLSGLPFLGRLDTARSMPTDRRALIDNDPDSASAAAYRLIVAKVSFRDGEEPNDSIVVVGTGPSGTNAQVASNLAAVAARGGRRVILVDADPIDGNVSRIFGLSERPGLADVVTGVVADVTSSLIRVTPSLSVLPRGVASDADALDVGRAVAILEALRERGHLIIVSTGPLHTSAGTLVWAQAADASIVVAVLDQSRRDDVTYAVESLRLVGVNMTGTVLADRRRGLGRVRGRVRDEPDDYLQGASQFTDPEPALAPDPPVSRPSRASRRRRQAGSRDT